MQNEPQTYEPAISRWTTIYGLFLLLLAAHKRISGEYRPNPMEGLRIANSCHELGLTREQSDSLRSLAAQFAACQLRVEAADNAKHEDLRLAATQQVMLATPTADRSRDYFQSVKRMERARAKLAGIIQRGRNAVETMENIRRSLRDI